MANKVNSSLKVFLEYDFDHRYDHPNRLAVAQGKTKNIFYLTMLDKNDPKAIEEKCATLDLPAIVSYVSKRQIVWLRDCKKNKLQYQLAWLSQLVKKYNENHKDEITYQNPAKWDITFKFNLENAFNETYQKKVVTKKITFCSTYDRLTTRSDILDKIRVAYHKTIDLQVRCTKINCDKIHTVVVAIYDLYKTLHWKGSLKSDPWKSYKPLCGEATNRECIEFTIEGDNRFLEQELNKIHEKDGCM